MTEGWVKAHRSMMEHGVWKDEFLVKLLLWCVFKANHEPRRVFGIDVERGQFITGRKRAAEELGVAESRFYRGIHRLEQLGTIVVKSNSDRTVITICNYETYQDTESETEQQPNSNRTATEHKQELNSLERDIYAVGLQNLIDGKLLPEKFSDAQTVNAINEYCMFFFRTTGRHLDAVVLRERLKLTCSDWPAEKVRRSMATTMAYNVTHAFYDPDKKPRSGRSKDKPSTPAPRQATPIT